MYQTARLFLFVFVSALPKHSKQVHLLELLLWRSIGRGSRQPIHLPDVPGDDVCDFLIFRSGWFPFPPLPQVLLKGHQQVDPGDQYIIPLELISIGGPKRPHRPLQPFFFRLGILTHHPQLPVQQAAPLPDGYGLAGLHVISADQIGRFAAGDLQPPGIHIALPLLPLGKLHCGRRRPIFEEHLFRAKPHLVGIVVHHPAHPQGGKHLGVLPGSRRLLLHSLPRPRFDNRCVFPCD